MDIRESLEKFLLDNYLAEPLAGYGHATAEQIADALLKNFYITSAEDSPEAWDEGYAAAVDDARYEPGFASPKTQNPYKEA